MKDQEEASGTIIPMRVIANIEGYTMCDVILYPEISKKDFLTISVEEWILESREFAHPILEDRKANEIFMMKMDVYPSGSKIEIYDNILLNATAEALFETYDEYINESFDDLKEDQIFESKE